MRDNLRAARLRNKLTQADMAELLGIARSYYTEIELGKKQPPVEKALEIADLLGESVEALFSGLESREMRQTHNEHAAAAEE